MEEKAAGEEGMSMGKGKRGSLLLLLLTAVIVCGVIAGMQRTKETQTFGSTSGLRFKNDRKLVKTVRSGLKKHSRQITIRFHAHEDHMDGIGQMVDELMEKALENTADPCEGDYIRYQYGGYQVRYTGRQEEKGYLYTVRIIPEYYTYADEEVWVTDEVNRILSEMDFSWKSSDYDKVQSIYDYVCRHVSYDVVHKKKEQQHKKTTAYAALKYRAAVCQGYAVLLYRLLREEGIDARVVTGIATHDGKEEFHAWNLVCLDGLYYNLDATWDTAFDTRDYFLKADETFSKDHVRDPGFSTASFYAQYPMAETDWR